VGQICAANPGRDFNDDDLQGVKVLAGLFALAVCRKRAEIELVEARDAAEAASRTKSEFLANVSHELRTPLNGMFGMLQLVRGTPLADEQQRWIDTALASGRNLLQVINDVLDLSKVEAGKIELMRAPFSLRGLIDSVRAMFEVAARDKSLTMAWSVDDALPDALAGDEGRIRQVLFNLVGNSLKFTDAGTISVSCQPGEARAPNEDTGQEDDSITLLFTVRDTGIGIPADKITSVFNAFEQVDGSSARRYQGAGLGLGIVKRFVELMGGEVRVESVEGEGTSISFTVRLGLAPSERVEQAPDADPAPEDMGRLRLLLAEDDRINQLAARALLEREGFFVDVADSGEAVLAALAENDYDCILMDIQMPGMDGLEATRAIRSDERFRDKRGIPIIALTAHAMLGDRENFIAAGMNDYLSKPMEIDALRRAVARVLGSAR
jgi:signal transduction histidine kinase/CheY-like chemotaxis protein